MNLPDSVGLEWLFSTQFFGIKLGLETPRRLLREVVGIDPDSPPFEVIHVAGTNGKGSTCAFAERLLREAGRRTGLFTSPHLVRFGERIRVDGVEIDPGLLEADIDWLRAAVAAWDSHPTFFELTLALAVRHFVREGVEVVVLETGMGGRLDATNALAKKVAALAPIGLDHARWLGDSIEEIAREKTGIIACGVPVVSAPQEPEVARVIDEVADFMAAPLLVAPALPEFVELGLVGSYQRENAALAVAAVVAAGCKIEAAARDRALAATRWPGRFELREEGRLVLDGAHNEPAARVLAQTWSERFGDVRALLICGFVDKDSRAILRHWISIVDEAWFVPVASPRMADPTALLACWKELGGQGRVCGRLAEALAAARADDCPVLVAGSLFLIGEATAILDDCYAPRPTGQ